MAAHGIVRACRGDRRRSADAHTTANRGSILANSLQAHKRARQAERRRARNASLRSKVRTHIKKVVGAVEAGDHAAATVAFQEAVPVIDAMVGKGILHRNKAARHKSRLARKIVALAPPAERV